MDFISAIKKPIFSIYFLPIILVLGIHVPFFIFGKDSFLITNDNLNAEFLYAHLLKISGNLFNLNQNAVIENIGVGLKLKYFHSPFILVKLPFLFFDSFNAYIINSIVTRYIGFIGLYFLIKDYLKLKSKLVVYILCLSFAILPLYTIFGLTILGQPFLLWAFLNLANNKKKLISIIYILIFIFYSNFQLIGPFAFFWLSVIGIYNYFREKKLNRNYILGLVSMIVFSIIANFSIISTVFSTGSEQSFRLSRVYLELPSFLGAAYLFLKTLFFGELVSSLFIPIPVILLMLILAIKNKLDKIVLYIFGIILFNILVYVLSPHLSIYLGDYISFFKAFGFGRFIYLNAFLFFIILIILFRKINNSYIIISISALILFMNSIRNMEFYYNSYGKFSNDIHAVYDEDKFIKSLVPKDLYNNDHHVHHSAGFLTFNEFYATELFKEIEDFIGKNKDDYKVINLGIHPSITQYNGFYSIDGYLPNYPLSLHTIFQKINKKELEKKEYYGEKNITINNGVYLTSFELSQYCNEYCFKKVANKSINNFDLNIKELKDSRVEYVFSAIEIQNTKKIGIEFQEVFEKDEYPYIIYLYKLI
jgi:hypothetical protein